MIKLIEEIKDGFCIFLNKTLLIEVDDDLKMDIDIQITLYKKDDGNYAAEYDVAEYHNVFFKGKQVDSSYKKWGEWVTNYNNLMQSDLTGDIDKYLEAYFTKYEKDPLSLTTEFNIKL